MKQRKLLSVAFFLLSTIVVGFLIFAIKDSTIANVVEVKPTEKEKLEKIYRELQLKSYSGKSISLNENKSKLIILNFWASWCTPCMRELPGLNRLATSFEHNEIEVIGINCDAENQDAMIKKTIKNYNIKFPIVPDRDSTLVNQFAVDGIPTTFFFKGNNLLNVSASELDFDSKKIREKINLYLQAK